MNLTRTAITRPVFVLMLVLAAIVLGLLSYSGMRKELNPDVEFGVVTIATTYPGANPDDVNTLVSRKIEEAVSGVNGLREVTSSSQEGISVVVANFNLDQNIDAAVNDVRSKVDGILDQLPKEVDKPTISKLNTSAMPVLNMGFTATNLNSQQLRDLIDDKLKDRFAQIEGVAEVDVQGGDIREIQVQVDKDKLLAYGIGITDVQKAIANSTLNVPSGHVVSGDRDYDVRVLGEFTNVNQIKNMIFTVADPHNPMAKPASVRLGDVANVVDTVQERTAYGRINGQDSIVVVLQKARDGNAVDVVKAARGVIAALMQQYKADGLKIITTQDQSTQITDSLNDLTFSLSFGIFLVCAIIYIFLHNFRGTLIVALAIPTCICVTLIAIKAAGFTINNLTMLALSLAVAVLVDDAIVVIENIYRHLQLGEAPRDAALNGRMEIGVAALAITMADVVVFLPIGFTGGIVGVFLKPLALGYVFAVLASLAVSFTLTPMLASRWYRKGENLEHPTGWFASRFERGFGNFERGYGRALEWALTHRWFIFVLGNIILLSVFMFIAGSFMPTVAIAGKSMIPMVMIAGFVGLLAMICNLFFHRFKPQLILYGVLFGLAFPVAAMIGSAYHAWKKEAVFKFAFFPNSDSGNITVNIELPPGSNLAATERAVEYVENKVKSSPAVKYYSATVGSQGVGSFSVGSQGSNYAAVNVTLQDKLSAADRIEFWRHPDPHLRSKSDSEVKGDLIAAIGHYPGARILVSAPSGFGGGAAIQLSFRGDNRELMDATAKKVADGLSAGAIPGVVNVDLSSKPGKPEVQAIPNRALLADEGITVNDLADSMRMLYQGDDTVKFRSNGREYVLRTMLSLKDRNNPDAVSQVPIAFRQGNPVFVPQVATLRTGQALDKIQRRDREEEVVVSADLLNDTYSNGTVQAQINSWLTQNHMVPEGVLYKPLGQADSQSREMGGLILAPILGLLFVYMLLASLYDNLLYPAIIQLAQPQALVGALLALMITNVQLDLVGFIGLIVLTGVVGKNAILLVDYTNTLRGRGRNRHDALVEAGPTRLRPILMTSAALVLGMFPIALALGRGSEFRQSIGIIVIGGVTLSTLLTLLVIPASYTIFDDLSLLLGRGARRIQAALGHRADDEAEAQPSLLPEVEEPEQPSTQA
ncbi:MAG: efflux RND transporter permease subunit [Fimbriimonadaceae bacterium]